MDGACTHGIITLKTGYFFQSKPVELFFVVAHCQFSCLHPAKLGECISVSTQLITLGHTRSRWRQTVFCEHKALCEATLTLAIVDAQGKLTKIHPSLKERLCHS